MQEKDSFPMEANIPTTPLTSVPVTPGPSATDLLKLLEDLESSFERRDWWTVYGDVAALGSEISKLGKGGGITITPAPAAMVVHSTDPHAGLQQRLRGVIASNPQGLSQDLITALLPIINEIGRRAISAIMGATL